MIIWYPKGKYVVMHSGYCLYQMKQLEIERSAHTNDLCALYLGPNSDYLPVYHCFM